MLNLVYTFVKSIDLTIASLIIKRVENNKPGYKLKFIFYTSNLKIQNCPVPSLQCHPDRFLK